jgi:hypothetical protein
MQQDFLEYAYVHGAVNLGGFPMHVISSVMALFLLVLSSPVQAQEERNLMVEVRIDGKSSQDTQRIGVSGQQRSVGIHAGQRTVQRSQNSVQRILVRDGGTATLSSIQTQPIVLRQVLLSPYGSVMSESYVYQSLGGGIRVNPQSQGSRVLIEVSAEDAKPVANQPLAADTLRLSTQISGQMGEWIMIGDDERSQGRQRSNVGLTGAGQGSTSGGGYQRVWLRVTPQ